MTLQSQAMEQIEKIRELRAQGQSQRRIADELGLTQPTISLALRSSGGDPLLGTLSEPKALPESSRADPVHLVARNLQEMTAAQGDLVVFLDRKIGAVAEEIDELDGAIEEAARNGWKTGTFENQHRRALTRKLYYEKCLAATRAGYTIIPDIPIDIFAIRTSRHVPRRNEKCAENVNYKPTTSVPDEAPQVLAVGEGAYRNPDTFVKNLRGSFKNAEGKDVFFHKQWAVDFDSIEFPVIAAVPYVMQATQQAMALRVFDQIGVSPQGSIRAADPLVIGQVLGVSSGWGRRKMASFLIAWHLDMRTL